MALQNVKKQNPFKKDSLTVFQDSVRLKQSQRDSIDQICDEYDVSFSVVIRYLVSKGLESFMNDEVQEKFHPVRLFKK